MDWREGVSYVVEAGWDQDSLRSRRHSRLFSESKDSGLRRPPLFSRSEIRRVSLSQTANHSDMEMGGGFGELGERR